MKIDRLVLKDFRNYAQLDLRLGDSITVLFGENAQGKTSILEALYLLSTGRSHRITDEKVCIRHGQTFALAKALVHNPHEVQLKAILHAKGKTLFFQNQPLRKSSEFIGKMNAVIFSPTDLDLFDASPKARRRLIDIELGKINPFYMELLGHYNKVLKERNASLKESSLDLTYLEVMTNQLIEDQVHLIQLRTQFIQDLNQYLGALYPKLSLRDQKAFIRYQSPIDPDQDLVSALKEKYQRSLDRDRAFKMTHVGIHRDDLVFELDDQILQEVGSQGQKRMFVIALKCALLEVVEKATGQRPVLLLDDVFSELDAKRRQALYELLENKTQTVITTTDLDDIRIWLHGKIKFYEVHQGSVIERGDIHE